MAQEAVATKRNAESTHSGHNNQHGEKEQVSKLAGSGCTVSIVEVMSRRNRLGDSIEVQLVQEGKSV